jgi:ankyrin repeat protein
MIDAVTNLINACVCGDAEKVTKILSKYPHIADINDNEALNEACENNHLEIMKILVRNGAWIDEYRDYLSIAIKHKNVEMVEFLLLQGCDPFTGYNEEIDIGSFLLENSKAFAKHICR